MVKLGLVTALLLGSAQASAFAQAPCLLRPVAIGLNVQGEPNLDLVTTARVGWIRINLRWSDVNPAPGVWRFERYDRQLAAAEARELQVLALLSHTPVWAGGNRNGTTPSPDVARWQEFVARVAARYRGRIAAYEIWNEPDLRDLGDGIGWNQDLTASPRYGDYLREASLAVRAEAPGTLVVGPSLSSGLSDRTVQLLAQLETEGASRFVDVVSLHQNVLDDDNAGQWLARLVSNGLQSLANRAPSLARKPIWVTELGWKSDEVGEAGQRDNLITALTQLTGSLDWPSCQNVGRFLVSHAFIYKLLDSPDEQSGVYRGDGTAKPIVTDYLQTLPFPASEGGPRPVEFRVSCDELTCRFDQGVFADPGPWRCSWVFGDGSMAPRRGRAGRFDPTDCREVTHRFSRPGRYVVDLDLRLGELGLAGRRAVTVTCPDTVKPHRVVLQAPGSGSTVRGVVEVLIEARDNRALAAVDLYANGKLVAGTPARGRGPYRLLWDTRKFTPGTRVTLQARALDTCGNTAFSTATVGRVEVVVGE